MESVGFASDLVGNHAGVFASAAQGIGGARASVSPASGVIELGAVDAAFSALGIAVDALNAGYQRSLALSAEGLTESLASLLALEQEIVSIVGRALGALS